MKNLRLGIPVLIVVAATCLSTPLMVKGEDIRDPASLSSSKNNTPAGLCEGEAHGAQPGILVADAQNCLEMCSSQAKTCLRGCDNISDKQQQASCYDGCRSGQEACRGRCQ
jgi:hypothetical protein